MISNTGQINGRDVSVEWGRSAEHEMAPDRNLISVSDKLAIFFRPVTSAACSFEIADRLGRQPEIKLETPQSKRIGPRFVSIDYVRGQWRGNFWI